MGGLKSKTGQSLVITTHKLSHLYDCLIFLFYQSKNGVYLSNLWKNTRNDTVHVTFYSISQYQTTSLGY